MTRLASTWATAVVGVTLTGTALASPQAEPQTDEPPPAEPPGEPAQPPPPPPVMIEQQEQDIYTAPVVQTEPPPREEDDEYRPLTGIGVGLAAGGGAGGFTNDRMRDTTNVGGEWDVRATIGTRSPIAFEGSYIGSAQEIDALGLDNDAVLVGNGVQGALRINATLGFPVQPFLFAGAAWRNYQLTNADVNLSDVEENDNVLEIPLGVGIQGMYRGLLLDARGEFRATTYEDLVPELTGVNDFASMHRWSVKGTIGYEF